MKTISILCVVNTISALSQNSLCDSVYFIDDNRLNGSKNEGTEFLQTKVKKGDTIIWTVISLEGEAFVSIDNIQIDNNYCEIEKKSFEETDVTYWMGTIKENIPEELPYTLGLLLGNRTHPMFTNSYISLIE